MNEAEVTNPLFKVQASAWCRNPQCYEVWHGFPVPIYAGCKIVATCEGSHLWEK